MKIKASAQDWKDQLPYTLESNWLNEIKKDFAILIQTNNSIGFTDVISALKLYLELKLEISKSDLIWFAKLLYAIITQSNLNSNSNSICDAFIQIVQDEEDLPSDSLELDWKPLFNSIYSNMYPLHGRSYPSNLIAIVSLVKVAKMSNRFFKDESAKEILEEILPNLNLHNLSQWTSHLGLLALFLPINSKPKPMDNVDHNGYFWVPTLFNLWSRVANSSNQDMLFLDIFGRLAKEQVCDPFSIGWGEREISYIFARGARMLGLPVGSGASGLETASLSKKGLSDFGVMDLNTHIPSYFQTSKSTSFARCIIYSLFPEGGPKTNTMAHFTNFIRAVEPFAHPSNSGKWSSSVAKLCLELSQILHERCVEEEQNPLKKDSKFRLTSPIIRQVSVLINQIVQMTIFGKDGSTISSSQTALKYLAWINPEAVISSFLQSAYPSLEGLTETHRTISCLGGLYSISTPLLKRIHYPEGGQNLLSLLNLCLPGLDVNDIQKSITSLVFIFSTFSNVPIVNSSEHSSVAFDYPASNYTAITPTQPSSIADEICCSSTAEFESWLAQFMERIFTVLENLPQNYGVGDKITIEGNLLESIYFTCHIVFSQLSRELESMVARMLFKKAQSSLIPAATEAIGSLCGLLYNSNPEKRLDMFLPLCIDRIKQELENNAGSTPSGNRFVSNPNPFDFAVMSDATLHWFQSILLKVVANAGSSLLKYQTELEDILHVMAEKCASKRGYLWTGNLLSNILDALTGTYPNDFRSHPSKVWNDANFVKTAHCRWGEHFSIAELDIAWHVPSVQEIEFACKLANMYFEMSISKLQSFTTTSSSSSSDFTRWISMLNSCIMGSHTFLKPPTGALNHGNYGEFTGKYSPNRQCISLNAGFLFEKESHNDQYMQWSKMVERTQTTLLNLLDYFSSNRLDDIESVKALLQCIKTLLTYSGLYESASWLYSYSKTILKAGKDVTVFPRSIMVSRVYMLHLKRVQESIKGSPTTELVVKLIYRLFDFSLSKYAEVRRTAQSALFSSMRNHRSIRFDILSKSLNVLKESGTIRDPKRIKGALYILKDRFSIMGVYIYYLPFTAQFLDAILFNHGEESPTILELLRQVVLDFSSLFTPIEYPEYLSTDPLLSRDVELDSTLLQRHFAIKRELEIENSDTLIKLQSRLIELASGKMNWRFEAMTIHFLDLIISPTISISDELINMIFGKIVGEHPSIRSNCNSLLAHVIDTLKDQRKEKSASSSFKFFAAREDSTFNSVFNAIEFDLANPEPTQFYDQTRGWLLQPNKIGIYRSVKEKETLPFSNQEKLLIGQLESDQFWNRLLALAEEESSKEQFRSSNADFYKRLFVLVQERGLIIVLPKLEVLISKTQENNCQRAASELIAGIIRGAKFWSKSSKILESKVYPLLFKAINAASIEAIRHWLSCIRYILSRRDPARHSFVISQIVNMPLDLTSSSFLTESKKIWLKDLVLQTSGFRGRKLAAVILDQLVQNISTPFQQVRDALGKCMDDCFQLEWSYRFSTLDALLQSDITTPLFPSKISLNKNIPQIFAKLSSFRKEPFKLGSASLYGNSCKSVLAWFGYALTSYQTAGISNVFEFMAEKVLDMQDYPDQDLVGMANQMARVYPNFLHDTAQLEKVFEVLIDICSNASSPVVGDSHSDIKSWHMKTRVLSLLQVLYFRHIYTMSEVSKQKVMHLLDTLIMDSQLEVRRIASITLSGIVQCSERLAIDNLIKRYSDLLKSITLPKRKRTDPIPDGFSSALVQKHSAVLGLSSLVLAFPYELPDFVPGILVLLANCSDDPSPISNSVTHLFGQFKRTHQDTWERDKLKFTPENLYIVSDLIFSPGYFA